MEQKKGIKKSEFDFNNFKSFRDFINKCDYDPKKILNKKCKVSEKDYHYFLNVMFPANWINNKWDQESSFVLNECLTENIYYRFYKIKNKCWCCCERINLFEIEV